MSITFIHDMPSDTDGKTWKEKNLEIKHNIPIGSLVEVSYDGAPNKGVRLFVAEHSRDCDGTPLYTLTWSLPKYHEFKGIYRACFCIGGYGEESLTVIKRGGE